MNADRREGFTLIELILAIGLTAVVGMMSYAGLDVVSSANEAIQRQAERIQEINLAMTIMARDFRQIQPRAVRDENGESITAFWGNGTGEDMVSFTRAGWSNPTGSNRSKLQRVHYHYRQDDLVRETWNVLDRNTDAQSFSNVILGGIESVNMRFLLPIPDRTEDSTARSEWLSSWEPTDLPESDNAYTPLAVELTIDLDDWGTVRRIYITSPYWPRTQEFARLGLDTITGRTQEGSGRTQEGSGRTQRGSGRTQEQGVR
jgi:general secretion pathway protein J